MWLIIMFCSNKSEYNSLTEFSEPLLFIGLEGIGCLLACVSPGTDGLSVAPTFS